MFLMMVAFIGANNIQENTEPQKAMPLTHVSSYIDAKPAPSQNSTDNYVSTQWAIPITLPGELPGFHPNHSKPKCLQNIHRQDYHCVHFVHAIGCCHPQKNIHSHVIDYYIYTLEHILI